MESEKQTFNFYPSEQEVENTPQPTELDQVVEVSEYFNPHEKFDYAQDTMPIPAYYPNREDQERGYNPDPTITGAHIRSGAHVYAIPGIQFYGQIMGADTTVHITTPSGVITGRYHGSYGFPSEERTLWVSKNDALLVREESNEL